jgi:hypothetical protein
MNEYCLMYICMLKNPGAAKGILKTPAFNNSTYAARKRLTY